jgi:hypothetical protein
LSIVVWMFAINAVSSSYCFIRDAKGFMLPCHLGRVGGAVFVVGILQNKHDVIN